MNRREVCQHVRHENSLIRVDGREGYRTVCAGKSRANHEFVVSISLHISQCSTGRHRLERDLFLLLIFLLLSFLSFLRFRWFLFLWSLALFFVFDNGDVSTLCSRVVFYARNGSFERTLHSLCQPNLFKRKLFHLLLVVCFRPGSLSFGLCCISLLLLFQLLFSQCCLVVLVVNVLQQVLSNILYCIFGPRSSSRSERRCECITDTVLQVIAIHLCLFAFLFFSPNRCTV
mmetsp:Transcript_18017/g.44735  ORF Transcript_18017/g.44735 Transcript_18017/m.44735 type:complete len:230 (-) Transcript_18017:233-922(-)